jgi:hypothetical protein
VSAPETRTLAGCFGYATVLVGHTADLNDETARILIGRHRLDGPSLDLRCPGCRERTAVYDEGVMAGGALDGQDLDREPLFLVEHEDGCGWFAAVLALEGES